MGITYKIFGLGLILASCVQELPMESRDSGTDRSVIEHVDSSSIELGPSDVADVALTLDVKSNQQDAVSVDDRVGDTFKVPRDALPDAPPPCNRRSRCSC